MNLRNIWGTYLPSQRKSSKFSWTRHFPISFSIWQTSLHLPVSPPDGNFRDSGAFGRTRSLPEFVIIIPILNRKKPFVIFFGTWRNFLRVAHDMHSTKNPFSYRSQIIPNKTSLVYFYCCSQKDQKRINCSDVITKIQTAYEKATLPRQLIIPLPSPRSNVYVLFSLRAAVCEECSIFGLFSRLKCCFDFSMGFVTSILRGVYATWR